MFSFFLNIIYGLVNWFKWLCGYKEKVKDTTPKELLIKYVQSHPPPRLQHEITTLDWLNKLNLQNSSLIPLCLEVHDYIHDNIKILPKIKKDSTPNKLVHKKKLTKRMKPAFSEEQIVRICDEPCTEKVFKDLEEILNNVTAPVTPFNSSPITLQEFADSFSENVNFKRDMIGMSKGLLRKLPNSIKLVLVNQFNQLLRNKNLVNNIAFGRATFEYKVAKNGALDDINSYRKIVSIPQIVIHFHRILTLRLQKYFMENGYINTDIQKGGVSGQSQPLFQQYFKVSECIRQAQYTKTKLAVGFLDLTNAFGSLDRKVLFKLMRQCQVSELVVSYLEQYYDNFEYYVVHEPHLPPLKWDSIGLIQGCALSPVLFVFAIGQMMDYVQKKYAEEHGFPISGTKLLLTAFMDDICIICKDSQSLTVVFNEMDRLFRLANLKFNFAKCAVMLVNHTPDESKSFNLCGIPQVDKFKYLGHQIVSARMFFTTFREHMNYWSRILWAIDNNHSKTYEEKIADFERNVVPIIRKEMTSLYNLRVGLKYQIVNLITGYLKKWNAPSLRLGIFVNAQEILKNVNDTVILKILRDRPADPNQSALEKVQITENFTTPKVEFKYD